MPWECGRPDLSRRRGQSTNVMVRDLDIAQGFAQVGGYCRRFVPLWRSAAGSGRDIGVCAPWRWNAAEESRHNQWSGSEARSEAEGGQLCGTGGRARMQAKWADDGLEKRKLLCSVGHNTRRSRHRKSSRRAPRSRITDGGAVCCLVRQRKRSQLRCWNVEVTQERGRVPSVHEVLGDARHA